MWNKKDPIDAAPVKAWHLFSLVTRRHDIKYMSPGHEDNRR